MTKKPPGCKDCCIRTVTYEGTQSADVTFTASSWFPAPSEGEDDQCSSCRINEDIKMREPEINVQIAGDNECGVDTSALKSIIEQDIKADREDEFSDHDWTTSGPPEGGTIREQILTWKEENCSNICELSAPGIFGTNLREFVNSPQTVTFTQIINSRSREAEFCGKNFVRFVGGPGDDSEDWPDTKL